MFVMWLSVVSVLVGRVRLVVVRFLCRCVIDDVLGISRRFGVWCSSYVSVICIGVVLMWVVMLDSVDDCSGEKLLSGKYGMYVILLWVSVLISVLLL